MTIKVITPKKTVDNRVSAPALCPWVVDESGSPRR